MSVIIFGSNGFIGRNLYGLLKEKNIEVKGVSRFPSPYVDHVLMDISEASQFENLTSSAETVVICAAKLPGPYTEESLEQYYQTNVIGTWNILNWAKKNGIKQVVFCSTLAVIATEAYEAGPVTEESTTYSTGAHYQYTSSKLTAEMLCSSFCREHGMVSQVLRIAAVYGSGMPWVGVLCSFIDRIRNGEEVEISNPAFNADFIHVKDIALGIHALLGSSESGIINFASGIPVTLQDLVEAIEHAGDFPVAKVKMGMESAFPLKKVNVQKYANLISPERPMSITEGVKELIENQ